MSDVMTVSLNQAKECILHLGINHNHRVLLEGSFGIGKTDSVKQAAKAITAWPQWLLDKRPDLINKPVKTHLLVEHLGNYQGVELNGYPAPDHERKLATWYMAETVPFKENKEFDAYDDHLIVWFLDEFASCQPDVMLIAQQLMLDNRLGKNYIRDNVVIVAATNRECDGAVVNPMPKPLANRMIRINVEPDVHEWLEYSEDKLPTIALTYHQYKTNMLCTYSDKNPVLSNGTPRSWSKFWEIFQQTDIPMPVREAGMYGAVGTAAALDALTFVKLEASVPNLDDILKDPEGFALPTDLSVQYLTCIGISGMMNHKNVDKFYKYLTRNSADLVIMVFTMACKREDKQKVATRLIKTSTFMQYAKDYLPAVVPDYKGA